MGRKSDDVLVIHDIPTNTFLKGLVWIVAGSIAVISALSIVTSQDVLAAVILIVVLVVSVALMTRGITTEINLTERTIRRTWKIGAFEWHRAYSLDDYESAEIQDKSRLIEEYPLSFFTVSFIGRGKHIKIYSTDDPEDAKAAQAEIAGFLRKAVESTPGRQSG